jgi:tol-pal system protein YbgF
MTSLVRSLPQTARLRRGLALTARLRRGGLAACPAVLVAVCLALAVQPALAQSVETQLQRLQRELSDLQRQVYGGAAPPAAAGGTAATPAAHMQIQLNELESQIAELTGRIEDLGFRLDTVTDRLDRLVADVDLRLRNLEQGGLPPVGAEIPADGTGQLAAQPPLGQTPSAQAPSGAPSPAQPGSLGTLRESDLSTFQQQQAQQQQQAAPPAPATPGAQQSAAAPGGAAALPGGTPQEQYDYAFGLLRQANYAGAEQAFSAFLAAHSNHALAGNAKYWLGETYYVRGNYQQAAVTFAEGFEAYPDNSKAPDNLLKLGMSLASLGSTQDACGTFDVLLDRYGDAPATILSRAQREAQRLGCR